MNQITYPVTICSLPRQECPCPWTVFLWTLRTFRNAVNDRIARRSRYLHLCGFSGFPRLLRSVPLFSMRREDIQTQNDSIGVKIKESAELTAMDDIRPARRHTANPYKSKWRRTVGVFKYCARHGWHRCYSISFLCFSLPPSAFFFFFVIFCLLARIITTYTGYSVDNHRWTQTGHNQCYVFTWARRYYFCYTTVYIICVEKTVKKKVRVTGETNVIINDSTRVW